MRTLRPALARLDTRAVRPPAKAADPHYGSAEHREWRSNVIGRAAGRCEWVEGGVRCGRAEPVMFADHIDELKDGGAAFDPANGQCLCGSHHTLKTARAKAARLAAHPKG